MHMYDYLKALLYYHINERNIFATKKKNGKKMKIKLSTSIASALLCANALFVMRTVNDKSINTNEICGEVMFVFNCILCPHLPSNQTLNVCFFFHPVGKMEMEEKTT